jgi:acetyltransferase-like isoleucine patch superfamily enzyme
VTVVTELAPYTDDRGNSIEVTGPVEGASIRVNFRGSNNHLVVGLPVRLGRLVIDFDCDNGLVRLGPSANVPAFSAAIRVGQDSKVLIGRNVSCTSTVAMSATEGTTIAIGEDVMFASENQVRADDGHPIFDVRTGKRVNVSKSIRIGDHVWLGRFSTLLGGARIGSGSVIGYGSIVTGHVPNNCIAAGVPAHVIRKDVAWERPHLSLTKPHYKPDASTITKSAYWARTAQDEPFGLGRRMRRRLARVGWLRRLHRAVRARRAR